jgi:hypothetical protein
MKDNHLKFEIAQLDLSDLYAQIFNRKSTISNSSAERVASPR